MGVWGLPIDPVRDKPRRSGWGRIARAAQTCYSGSASETHAGLRQGMSEVTPVEIRAAVAHSAQEPTEATPGRLHATPERRRNLRHSGRGGCQTPGVSMAVTRPPSCAPLSGLMGFLAYNLPV